MYALVDCNSFYASCERLFRPDLHHKAVIVLSNNDGCVVARSAEAKALGVGMAVPFFQVKKLCKQKDIAVFSSNYTLYQDISNRVMCTLESLVPHVDIYSIDEAFLDLHGVVAFSKSPNRFASNIRHTLYKHVGVPVGVGIAPTKTLAKLANHHAKKEQGICVLNSPELTDFYLKQTPVNDVWGVGKGLTARLYKLGITTAYELAHADKYWLRKHGSVMLERTARELQGEPCHNFLDVLNEKQRKQVICSRSFGRRVTDKEMMREALCHYTARASEKLRAQKGKAKHISMFFRTSMFGEHEQQRRCSVSTQLVYPSQDTRQLTKAVMQLLDANWQDGYRYSKAGVILSDIYDEKTLQFDLLSDIDTTEEVQSNALLGTLDKINTRYGSHTMTFGGQGVTNSRKQWRMASNSSSPRYTTNFKELPLVY